MKNTGKLLQLETFGEMASSSLILCAFSGILLAIPYDVAEPYASVSRMMTVNLPALLIRNLHYWSAQFFLVFTLAHLFDHFLKKSERNLAFYQWALLVAALGVVFYAMLSGYILKGDADGMQAHRILSALLASLPALGHTLQYSLLGTEGDLQLVYVHHMATATVILIIMTYNHARRLFPGFVPFFLLLFILVMVSFFFQAPLHDGYSQVMKGPWYFLGLQELLHWMPWPGWTWLLVLGMAGLLVLIRVTRPYLAGSIKVLITGVTVIYLVLIVIGAFFRGENWEWKSWEQARSERQAYLLFDPYAFTGSDTSRLQTVNGRAEGCLSCHAGMQGLTVSHSAEAAGCSSCHGGNPFTLSKRSAHREMLVVPGNLSDARRSCGSPQCHPDIPARVDRSIMTTASGLVSVDRYVFGLNDSLDRHFHIRDLGHDAADQHLRDLCGNCHLGMTKEEPGPVNSLSRGGGCNACHLNYSQDALRELESYRRSPEGFTLMQHPSLDLRITDDHCFGCHSRSGRISLSYAGLHETLRDSLHMEAGDTLLEDKRVAERVEEDVHHKAGMWCIDCHVSAELMGDGNLYAHKEEQVRITCKVCHSSGQSSWVGYSDLDLESRKIAALRYKDAEERVYLADTATGLFDLMAGEVPGKGLVHARKMDGHALVMKPPAGICTEGLAHDRLSCGSCHSAWVPQCIGCHNEFDPEAEGMDLLAMREKRGSWVEYVSKFLHDRPVLGIAGQDGKEKVTTFTPGMILDIALDTYPGRAQGPGDLFRRLHAPASPHTTAAAGRTCASCHLDPLAMGYGRGELHFDAGSGKWTFISRYAPNKYDGLPEDAWTGFLTERGDQAATRYDMRPFNAEEQKAILTVGACLTCHEEGSGVMRSSLEDFKKTIDRRSPLCVMPRWD